MGPDTGLKVGGGANETLTAITKDFGKSSIVLGKSGPAPSSSEALCIVYHAHLIGFPEKQAITRGAKGGHCPYARKGRGAC